MDAPGTPQEGVVFTQKVVAFDDSRVNAVQGGDQYVYIYRGDPPYRVEPFPLIESTAAVPAASAKVPSWLLSARHRVVPYLPSPELADLEAWRDGETPGLSIRLAHAEGGAGKTRLAIEFAERSAAAGWAVALARHRSEAASAGGGDETLTVRPPGLVLVVDYAERWPLSDLTALVRQHRDAARDRLRLLLLSRPTGPWWQTLRHQFAKLDVGDVEAVKVEALPDDPAVRAEMYVAARDRFAEVFALADPARIGVPGDLDDPGFALTLTVHMRALVDVDAAARGRTPPAGSGQAALSSYLLDREHDYWRSSHDDGYGPVRTNEQVMGRAVYVATLTRAQTPAAAVATLARAGLVDGVPAGKQLVADHARCYPPANPDLVLDPLYPDRLGEDYLALTVPGNEDEFDYYATDPWAETAPAVLLVPEEGRDPAGADGPNAGALSAAASAGVDPGGYTRQALSVLVEAARRWDHLIGRHLDPLLRQHPDLAIAAGSATIVRLVELPGLDTAVLEAIEPHLPEGPHVELDLGAAALMARLTEQRLATTTDPQAEASLHMLLGWRYGHAGLHEQALAATRRGLDRYRRLAAEVDDRYQAHVALTLDGLGAHLADLGRTDEAVAAVEEAAEIYSQLTETDPAMFESGYALTLMRQGTYLSAIGRPREALVALHNALDHYRRLAESGDEVVQANYATTLMNQASVLSEFGRHQEALAALEEAIDRHRRLVAIDPDSHRPELATALSNLGTQFAALGRLHEALAAGQEAAEIHRDLARANPAAHQPLLALTLHNLGAQFAEVGRHQEALVTLEEAVGLYRQLVEANPVAHQPRLATVLSNLAAVLVAVGRRTEALEVSVEAIALHRELARIHPAAHEPHLVRALLNHADRLAESRQRRAAVAVVEEAVVIARRLAEADADAYGSHLADALLMCGLRRGVIGRFSESRPVAREATRLLRRLAAANRAGFRPRVAVELIDHGSKVVEPRRRSQAPEIEEPLDIGLAMAAAAVEADFDSDLDSNVELRRLASVLDLGAHFFAMVGKRRDALNAAQEAVLIYRRLAEADPAEHEPDLAHALINLGWRQAEYGRVRQALETTRESVALYRHLAHGDPELYEPDLAMTLLSLCARLKERRLHDGSLEAAQETVEIYRRLAEGDPATHDPDFADALMQLAWRLVKARGRRAAVEPAREAVDVYRRLAEADRATYERNFLSSLHYLGHLLLWTLQPTEALVPLREMTAIRKQRR